MLGRLRISIDDIKNIYRQAFKVILRKLKIQKSVEGRYVATNLEAITEFRAAFSGATEEIGGSSKRLKDIYT